MNRPSILIFALSILLILLSACAPLAGSANAQPEATPTECSCSAEGPRAKTPSAVPSALTADPAGPPDPQVTASPSGAAAPEDMESYRDRWETYTAALPAEPARELSFAFPAAYAGKSFGFCAPRVTAGASGALLRVDLGSRTTLTVTAASGNLNAAAEALRAEPARSADSFDAPQELTIAGAPALKLPYRMGGAGRYGEVALFEKDGLLFRVEAGTPSACDIPALNLRELDAYQRVLDTLEIR